MHKLQLLLGSIAGLAWEGAPSLPCQHTSVTELLNMLNARHTPHHLFLAKLLQRFEVKVPEALVLAPRFIITAHHGARQDIEVVPPAHEARDGCSFLGSPWPEDGDGNPRCGGLHGRSPCASHSHLAASS